MKVLIDIGHPAHVHYFKNLIIQLVNFGETVLVVARDKEVSHLLLDSNNIPYCSRGAGGTWFLSKALYLFIGTWRVLKVAQKYKPDVFLSAGSMYASVASKVMNKPHIAIEDSENLEQIRIYKPFTDLIISPKYCKKKFGAKNIRINGFLQSAYLRSEYFTPNEKIFEVLGLQFGAPYFILRFVALGASHDRGLKTSNIHERYLLVEELKKHGRVFISSEGLLPDSLLEYAIKIPPHQMHDAIYYSKAVLGESGAMTNEAAFLGVPSYLLVDPNLGVHYGFRDLGLKKIFQGFSDTFKNELKTDLIKLDLIQENNRTIALEYQKKSLDLTVFLHWTLNNLPKSLDLDFIMHSYWSDNVQ
ncbi:MAG: DUF354 domain-containing protein [Ignavibacteriales bacterium]|nr:DUF354 domain-containing protein [Ignavibacteriales bacterium]MCF8435876.1 DUF354 domain-containing protein [Ignavibacteriales bacterium]